MIETGNKFHDNVSRQIYWGHWFTFFNMIIVYFIALRYIKYAGLPDSILGIGYQFISLIGHFSFLCAIFYSCILFPLAFIIPFRQVYRFICILIVTCAISLLIIDTQIFNLYNFHLNPMIWKFLVQPEQLEKIYTINLHYISIPIIFVLETLISIYICRRSRRLYATHVGKEISIFLFTTFIISHLLFIWADATQYRDITQQKSTFPLSYPMTARSFLNDQGWLDDQKLHKRIMDNKENKVNDLKYPLKPLLYDIPEIKTEPLNILLVTVDSLRADMLNETNMPVLFRLSKQGIKYNNHFSGANNRAQGIYSLFYALPNRYWSSITLSYTSPVLMDKLIHENYQFGVFSSIGFTEPEFLQSSFSQLSTKELSKLDTSNSDRLITRKWSNWYKHKKNNKPWFSFLYYKDPQSSVFDINDQQSLKQKTDKLRAYQKDVLKTDKYIGSVIKSLKRNKEFDNTLVIITGTNGASFASGANSLGSINDNQVPFVMLWPGRTPETIERMTSHVDLAPTILEGMFAASTTADQYSTGQNLFDKTVRSYVLSGDRKNYLIYEKDHITKFSRYGDISMTDWQGNLENEDDIDINLLVDVLSQLRRFNDN